jgi:hypothetical protein
MVKGKRQPVAKIGRRDLHPEARGLGVFVWDSSDEKKPGNSL